MLGATFKRAGRCHPWCGNREYLVGRAAEIREWHAEVFTETWEMTDSAEYDYRELLWRLRENDYEEDD